MSDIEERESCNTETTDQDEGFVDAVVTAWFPPGPGRKFGSGFLRVLDEGRQSLYLRESNIVTLGIDQLKVGRYVRCKIGLPEPGYNTPTALDVEIYEN